MQSIFGFFFSREVIMRKISRKKGGEEGLVPKEGRNIPPFSLSLPYLYEKVWEVRLVVFFFNLMMNFPIVISLYFLGGSDLTSSVLSLLWNEPTES